MELPSKLKEILDSMKGKWSTVSNILYFFSGLLFLLTPDPMVTLSGLWLMFLGIASGGFHWTGKRIWQQMDVGAIYGTFWTIIYTLIHFLVPDLSLWFLVPASLISGGIMLGWKWEFSATLTVPLLYILIFILMEAVHAGARNWIVTSFLLAGSAAQFIGQELFPDYSDEFHAAWHLLTNVGLALIVAGLQ